MSGSQRPAMLPPESTASTRASAKGVEPSTPRPKVSAELIAPPSSAGSAGEESGGPPVAAPQPLSETPESGREATEVRPEASEVGPGAPSSEAGGASNRDPGPALRPREHLYRAALGLVRPFARSRSRGDEKFERGLAGRRESVQRFTDWAAEHRDPSVPLVWVHAPSAGETLMAKAIIAELRKRRPGIQVAFTHFSPSAERLLEDVGADVTGYLPWDTRREARAALDALQPAVIAYVRSEVWPVLGAEAKRRGVRVALVNAALAPTSSRLRPAARWLLGPAYGRLDRVGATAEADANLHAALGVLPSRTGVTGDARFDQVLARLGGELPEDAERLADPDTVTLVAGSTWPEDEDRLLPAFFRACAGARLVIAPHEPTEAHLVGIEDALSARYLTHRRLSSLVRDRQALPQAVVVDRLGILADLYRIADIAFVGGGFTENGVHSVIEPAAVGVPVIVGPAHGNAREAAELVAAGGGVVVQNAAQLEGRLRTFTQYETAREAAGNRARAYVHSRTGGAAANAAAILALVEG